MELRERPAPPPENTHLITVELDRLVDERIAAIKSRLLPTYRAALDQWQDSLEQVESWYQEQTRKFTQFADNISAQYKASQRVSSQFLATLQTDPKQFKRRGNYVPHYCHNGCWKDKEVPDSYRYSPLTIPLKLGWQRVTMLCSQEGHHRNHVQYLAPCGRRLRSMEEVQQFLDITGVSTVSITHFTFDPQCTVHTFLFDPKAMGAKVYIPDVSEGKENRPVSCCNELDCEVPERFEYVVKRSHEPNIQLNTERDFLVSCSCPDNCLNRSTCMCWQLTIQESQALGEARHSVGYVHRRLKRAQHSAIYECNVFCSCGPQCANKVVQHGLQHRLQVFRTKARGWGLRTLDDIPKGSFVCTYIGHIYTEQGGEEKAIHYGDEYFAELDYIEVMEHCKQGYESDMMETLSESSTTSSDDQDSSYSVENASPMRVRLRRSAPVPLTPVIISSDEEGEGEGEIDVTPSLLSTPTTTPTPSSGPRSREPSATPLSPSAAPLSPSVTPLSPRAAPLSPNVTPLSPRAAPLSPNVTPLSPRAAPLSPIAIPLLPSAAPLSPRATPLLPSPFPLPIPHTPSFSRLQIARTRRYFSEDHSYIMDAKTRGNLGRYINHSCCPNMFVQNVFIDTHDLRFPWVAYFAKKRIKALQELTWDYNYEVGSVEGKNIQCLCGAPNCRGRLL